MNSVGTILLVALAGTIVGGIVLGFLAVVGRPEIERARELREQAAKISRWIDNEARREANKINEGWEHSRQYLLLTEDIRTDLEQLTRFCSESEERVA